MAVIILKGPFDEDGASVTPIVPATSRAKAVNSQSASKATGKIAAKSTLTVIDADNAEAVRIKQSCFLVKKFKSRQAIKLVRPVFEPATAFNSGSTVDEAGASDCKIESRVAIRIGFARGGGKYAYPPTSPRSSFLFFETDIETKWEKSQPSDSLKRRAAEAKIKDNLRREDDQCAVIVWVDVDHGVSANDVTLTSNLNVQMTLKEIQVETA